MSRYDRRGFDKNGIHRITGTEYNTKGRDICGYNQEGYHYNGFDRNGYDREGYDQGGFDHNGYNRRGHDRSGRDREGYDLDGYNTNGVNRKGEHWTKNKHMVLRAQISQQEYMEHKRISSMCSD